MNIFVGLVALTWFFLALVCLTIRGGRPVNEKHRAMREQIDKEGYHV